MHNDKDISTLTDTFGRHHNYLRISLTEKCNLKCTYCMPAEGVPLQPKSHYMTADEIISIATTFVEHGVNKIRLTGGEPLVRKDFSTILLGLAKLPVKLSITTNAALVHRFIADLKAAKVSHINVSLDSLQAERMNKISRTSTFETITKNIDLLIDEGFKVKVNVVLMTGVNDDEITDFVAWTKHRPIAVRFIEFMPFSGNEWDRSKTVPFAEIMDRVQDAYPVGLETLPAEPNLTSRDFRIPGHQGTFGIISTITNPFCDGCNRIRLTADGKLKNCLFSEDESDLLAAHRSNQPLAPIIKKAIVAKQQSTAGIPTFDAENGLLSAQSNRSMIRIGG